MKYKKIKKPNFNEILDIQSGDIKMFCCNEYCKNHYSPAENFYYKKGFFFTKKLGKNPRYQCKECGTTFSPQTFKTTYKEIRPELNEQIYKMYSSGVSLRRLGKVLGCNKNTVTRKFYKISDIAKTVHHRNIIKGFFDEKEITEIQLDEMETFENTKLKPVSIVLAVDSHFRVLDFNTAKMKAKGKNAKKSRAIYGKIKSEVDEKIRETLSKLKVLLNKNTDARIFKTDGKPSYNKQITDVFQEAKHLVYHSRKVIFPSNDKEETKLEYSEYNTKKKPFDPLFAINHICSRIRNNLARLHRRTWANTKHIDKLKYNLYLFTAFNNNYSLPICENLCTNIGGS